MTATAWGVGLVATVMSVVAYAVTVRRTACCSTWTPFRTWRSRAAWSSSTSPGLGSARLRVAAAAAPAHAAAGLDHPAVPQPGPREPRRDGRLRRRDGADLQTVSDAPAGSSAGCVAAAVFGLNVNVLYMQSTPDDEALLFCMLAAMVYCVQQWADTDWYTYLVARGVAAVARHAHPVRELAGAGRPGPWPWCSSPGSAAAAAMAPNLRRSSAHGPRRRLRRRGVRRDRGLAHLELGHLREPAELPGRRLRQAVELGLQGRARHRPLDGRVKTYWYAMRDNETWPVLLLARRPGSLAGAREWRSLRSAARAAPALSLLVLLQVVRRCPCTGERPLGRAADRARPLQRAVRADHAGAGGHRGRLPGGRAAAFAPGDVRRGRAGGGPGRRAREPVARNGNVVT